MKKHIYEISWIIRINRTEKKRHMYVEADNMKEARAAFDSFTQTRYGYNRCYDPYNETSHCFHIEIKRADDAILDYHAFCISA